ncbi:hypothetical protein BURMUCGD2M_1637 [Burkholderia multivorans CGD2M]|uniref:Uncharacterized protein n=1 Tax=Burkholderia multivorans CGD2 TaxID=513052 RepID=B9C003_9BURK|nr:hypothetical protein BURMUCGD2_1542 [Burkholderia multivorans CGD2]EEE14710.1 hypothetical protein BURMUCGD2M_1637 [Burkholderia multivorans CGD2M]
MTIAWRHAAPECLHRNLQLNFDQPGIVRRTLQGTMTRAHGR